MFLSYPDPQRDKVNQKPKQLDDFLLRRGHHLLVPLYTNVKAQIALILFLDPSNFEFTLSNRNAANFK